MCRNTKLASRDQRVFVEILGYFEIKKGYSLIQAEALAYATIKALINKFTGYVALIDKLPTEIAIIIRNARKIFS